MIIPGGPVMDLQNSSHELLLKLSLEPRKLKSRASVMSLQPSPVRMCLPGYRILSTAVPSLLRKLFLIVHLNAFRNNRHFWSR